MAMSEREILDIIQEIAREDMDRVLDDDMARDVLPYLKRFTNAKSDMRMTVRAAIKVKIVNDIHAGIRDIRGNLK